MFLKVLRVILFPLSVIYDLITRIRNHLYNSGYKPSFQFDVLTISVGNLNVGGSGKTPMVEYLIRLLKDRYRIATLSRGYRRATHGFRVATPQDDARSLGDEPFQLHRKFGPEVTVAVGEERVLAIPSILNEHPEVDCILLDDAFQHRSVRPHLSVLLTEFSAPFFLDYTLPTGNLREGRSGASRADVTIVTKCPDSLSTAQVDAYEIKVKQYTGGKPVYFSSITYDTPIAFAGTNTRITESIVLVSGIAHTETLRAQLEQKHKLVRHFRFPDHHRFTEEEVKEIASFSKGHNAAIVTTEKDMVRLIEASLIRLLADTSAFYVPIRMKFLQNGAEFDQFIIEMAKSALK